MKTINRSTIEEIINDERKVLLLFLLCLLYAAPILAILVVLLAYFIFQSNLKDYKEDLEKIFLAGSLYSVFSCLLYLYARSATLFSTPTSLSIDPEAINPIITNTSGLLNGIKLASMKYNTLILAYELFYWSYLVLVLFNVVLVLKDKGLFLLRSKLINFDEWVKA